MSLLQNITKEFLIYFETFSAPTADTLFLLVLSILTLESVHSIRFLYQHFLSEITTKSLNIFYHACSYAEVLSNRIRPLFSFFSIVDFIYSLRDHQSKRSSFSDLPPGSLSVPRKAPSLPDRSQDVSASDHPVAAVQIQSWNCFPSDR